MDGAPTAPSPRVRRGFVAAIAFAVAALVVSSHYAYLALADVDAGFDLLPVVELDDRQLFDALNDAVRESNRDRGLTGLALCAVVLLAAAAWIRQLRRRTPQPKLDRGTVVRVVLALLPAAFLIAVVQAIILSMYWEFTKDEF
jgi:hypothetical protein